MHNITAEEFVQAKATYSQGKRDRARDLVNMVLHTTIRRLPVVSNMRRIVNHLEAEASVVVDRPTLRARRRVDIDGKPLQGDDAIAA